ncbi:hypothetical protein O181_078378 [Austropuccinia psidii MF-1]|uniref:Allergen n=1 Tax=Austropuccinia psidii MF-1 TaxID=1389203 RepID=A0A9Q3FIV5_9BASI|nr:hypothetical protein [Austropuccinia psidii MF-1]
MQTIKKAINNISKDKDSIHQSERRSSKSSSKETPYTNGSSATVVNKAANKTDQRRDSRNETIAEANGTRSSQAQSLNPQGDTITQSQQIAAPVTHNVIKHHETEEVLRVRDHEKNIHHVQHHIQPIKDTEIREEVHKSHVAPVSVIKENFQASAEDAATFEALGNNLKDTVTYNKDKTKKVVDLGEKVNVKEHHHVHNIVQPVVEKETHERHRIHTTVPIHQVTNEAPIIHASIQEKPISMEEFLKKGGSLKSTVTHTDIGKSILTQEFQDSATVQSKQAEKPPIKVNGLEADVTKKLKI